MTNVSVGSRIAMAGIALGAIAAPLGIITATPLVQDARVDYAAARSPFRIEGTPTYANGQPVLDASGHSYTRSFTFPKERLLDNKAGLQPFPAPASGYVRFCGTVRDAVNQTVTQRGSVARRCTFLTAINPTPPTYWVGIRTRSHQSCGISLHQEYLENDNPFEMKVQMSYRTGPCGNYGPARTVSEKVPGKGTAPLGCQNWQEGGNQYCQIWTCVGGGTSCKAQPTGG